VPILILVVAAIIGLLWYSGQRYLFEIEVRSGKLRVAQGRVPQGLLDDFASALRNVDRGKVRAHKTATGARLSFGGDIDEGTAQRLRNIFGLHPMAKLRTPE
jgi:hypothetical protein